MFLKVIVEDIYWFMGPKIYPP